MNMMLILLLLFIPFIQLGYSYYASVSTASAGLVLLLAGKSNLSKLWVNFPVRVIASLLMVVCAASYNDASGQDLLRAAREAIALFLITGCASWSLPAFDSRLANRVLRAIWMVVTGTLVLVVIQTIYLRSHQYFGIPAEYFSQNANTVPGELALLYTNVRPSGSFAEPSYLGGICLALLFAVSPVLKEKRSVRFLAVALLTVVLISRSLSGILFCFLYLAFYARGVVRSPGLFYAFAAVFVIGLFAVAMTDNPISARLLNENGYDLSIASRIFGPLEAIPKILSAHLLGIPLGPFQDMGYAFSHELTAEEMTHNGLLNFVINYGILGFVLIGLLLYSFRNANSLLFVLALSMQNGGFASVDKFVIVAVSMILHNSFQVHLRSKLPPRNVSGVRADRFVRLGAI
ncbi:O-antigen ligase family protein [Bradyrhizobium sp. 151]|uniref:O-antigen ligase family protein n=1 Tax=Bradyrhizobium sp. 151 TaxID=2782626 RepID=UPI001FF89219|nr:O-antigen ligase family protein [Bradyrhizobium sp. 151]MCK1663445.1 O-antigen ligase family protein [Bradyrhizobium sp. 151]